MGRTRLSWQARWFVGLVFGLLAVSFIASTASVLWEFRQTRPDFILGAYSNLFVYFPTLGLVALAAFYVPAVIFTDLYLQGHVSAGPTRYVVGFIVVVATAYGMSWSMNETVLRQLWEIKPEVLLQEAGDRRACVGGPALGPVASDQKILPATVAQPGCRPTLLGAAGELTRVAKSRLTLSALARPCQPDPLVELPADYGALRYCIPGQQKLDTAECCRVQQQLAEEGFSLWSNPALRSQASYWDRWVFLPFKCFFVIVILLIGVLLIFRKPRLVARYSDVLPAMERGLQVGALAMLPWLVMDYGAQGASDTLYGAGSGFPARPSLVLLPWALLLAGYFAERIQVELVRLVQLASGILSAAAILNYRSVFDWSGKLLGVGASGVHLAIVVVFSLVALVYLFRWIPGALRGEDKGILPAKPQRMRVSNDHFT